MCQDIQKVTFYCGHQSSFCLTRNAHAARSANISRDRAAKQQRVCLKQAVENIYAKTQDAREEQQARHWETLAQKALSELTAKKVAELRDQIKERIASYLGKENMSPGGKVTLLRTITLLPDVFDHKDLVTFFASRYFGGKNRVSKFEDWERRKLFGIVKHARLERTFRAGLNLTEPVPLPVRL
ncbi:hypothetical protein F5B17DRAFT_430009 [Nemania serpens]|nr:hypothetical protein F5B17DRAFT_430009 [Nemania serpens]